MYDLCVLGGGIIGATTAIAGARAGLKVCIIERDLALLRGSTIAGFGALTPYSDLYFTGDAALFAEKSLKLYQKDWLKFLHQCTEIHVPLSQSGLMQIALDKAYLLQHKERYETGNCIAGYRPEYLTHTELLAQEPKLTIETVGAIYHPEPWIDLQLYLSAIEKCAHVFPNIETLFAKEAISVAEEGDQVTTRLNDGTKITSKYCVVATGLSNDLIEGIESFPIRWIRGDGIAVRTLDNQPLFKNIIYCNSGFISPRNSGEMLLGSTYVDEGLGDRAKLSGDRNRINFGAMADIVKSTEQISSHLRDCTVEREWHGWRPASSDKQPILGVDSSRPSIIYALGFLRLGITMSIGVGEAITQYAKAGSALPPSMSPERLLKK